MTSCSGPLSRRGAGSPRRAASTRSTPKPKACHVRASDSVDVPSSRAVTRCRSAAAAERLDVTTRQASARVPERTAATTTSTASVDLPVPGAPSTLSTLAGESSARRCVASRHTASATRAGARRRMTTHGFHHSPPTERFGSRRPG